jgi:hypothetical protein
MPIYLFRTDDFKQMIKMAQAPGSPGGNDGKNVARSELQIALDVFVHERRAEWEDKLKVAEMMKGVPLDEDARPLLKEFLELESQPSRPCVSGPCQSQMTAVPLSDELAEKLEPMEAACFVKPEEDLRELDAFTGETILGVIEAANAEQKRRGNCGWRSRFADSAGFDRMVPEDMTKTLTSYSQTKQAEFRYSWVDAPHQWTDEELKSIEEVLAKMGDPEDLECYDRDVHEGEYGIIGAHDFLVYSRKTNEFLIMKKRITYDTY